MLSSGLKCWGANLFGSLGLEDRETRGDQPNEMGRQLPLVNLGNDVVIESVVPGTAEHTCVMLSGGQIKCWGDDDYGQLGLESFLDRGSNPGEMGDALPTVELGTQARPMQLAAGGNHTCALLSDGSLRCWGNNQNGQLGLAGVLSKGGLAGDMGTNLPPVPLGGSRAVQVVGASVHTCALFEGGSVKCWGWERGFEDEAVLPDSPLTTVNLGGVAALTLAAGGIHTCAHLADQTVRCWAVTDHAIQPAEVSPPVVFSTLASLQQLSVGGGRGCARFADGAVMCWELAPAGTTSTASQIQLGRSALAMSATGGRDRHHGCALLDDGTVKCWGRNGDGQLGLGDTTPREGDVAGSLIAVDLGL